MSRTHSLAVVPPEAADAEPSNDEIAAQEAAAQEAAAQAGPTAPAPVGLMITEDVEVVFTRGPKEREATQFDAAVGRLPLDGSKGFTFTLPRVTGATYTPEDGSSNEADAKVLNGIRRELTSAGDLHDRTVRWQVSAGADASGAPVYRVDVKASKKIVRPNRKKTTAPASVDGAPSK